MTDPVGRLTCPIVTPFDGEGAVDDDALRELIDHVEVGVDSVFPCGTTGEFASLSPAERRDVIEVTADQASVPVVAGAAATSVAGTVEAVGAAADAGADAAVVVPPYFHTANAPAGNQRYFEQVADRSALPLLLYNIPQCTGGTRIEPETVAAVADHDRIVGLKDSSGDLSYLLSVQSRVPGEFSLLQGYDALLVPALRMGIDGGVNALSNALPEVFAEAVEHATDERGAILQREAITPVFEACTEYGFAPAAKAALVSRDVIPSDALRPPLVPIEDPTSVESAVGRALAVGATET